MSAHPDMSFPPNFISAFLSSVLYNALAAEQLVFATAQSKVSLLDQTRRHLVNVSDDIHIKRPCSVLSATLQSPPLARYSYNCLRFP